MILVLLFSVALTQPSQGMQMQVIDAFLQGIDYYTTPNSSLCFESVAQFTDDLYFTNKTNSTLLTTFNLTQTISSSLANATLYCPTSVLAYLGTSLQHFDQFYNLTVNEVLESFLIGVVSTSFSIR